MRKSRFTEEQIVGFIWQAEAGMLIKGLCRKGASATRGSRGYEQFHLFERRACRLAGLARDSYRDPRQESQMNQALSAKII